MKIPFFDLYLVEGEFLREQNELIKKLNETITIGEKLILNLNNTCELRKRINLKLLHKIQDMKDERRATNKG